MIIDHVDDLELSAEDVSRYFNELHSLDYLAQGLWLLFHQVRRMEGLASEALGADKLHVVAIVKIWRDKVGAHFARIDPRKDDTPADLAASVMFPVGFVVDAFVTNPFTLALSSGGQSSSSRADMQWSLTRTHRALAERYWPDAVVDQ